MILNNDKEILVIGGAGYVGSVLVRQLLDKNYKVKVLDNLIYGNGASLSDLAEEKNFRFIKGDFSDTILLDKIMPGVTDIVLLAAMVGDPISKKYPELTNATNLDGPQKLFDYLSGKSIDRFVFTSTCSNYGLRSNGEAATEEAELNPQSLYAETKVAFEKHILANLDNVDFSPTILRLATAFGLSKRMRFDLTISEFTRDLALGKDLLVYDENTWRPYCHVIDISNAIIRVIESPREKVFGQVLNVGSNSENYTKKMIIDLIQKYLPEAKVSYKEGGFDPRNYRVSFDKIKRELDFEPEISIEYSVKNLIDAVRNNLFTDVEERKTFYGNYQVFQK